MQTPKPLVPGQLEAKQGVSDEPMLYRLMYSDTTSLSILVTYYMTLVNYLFEFPEQKPLPYILHPSLVTTHIHFHQDLMTK